MFEELTGLDMLKIDIANCYGLDKAIFSARLSWFDTHEAMLESMADDADDELLFIKAVNAYRKAMKGEDIAHNMFMDATASGLQIMACLSNCKSTGTHTNLVFNGLRNDVYTIVSDMMMARLPHSELFKGLTPQEVRTMVKTPIMTHFYNSKANPKEVFGEDSEELECFYNVLGELFPGPTAVMEIIGNNWNPDTYINKWTMPDGHVCSVKVIEQVDARIEVPELGVAKGFNYRFYPNQPSKLATSLAPNIIHSIDAYIVRELSRRATYDFASIHDAMTSHPNNMVDVMKNYREVLAEITESDLLQDILSEVTGTEIQLKKFDYDLASEIKVSQYALS